MAVVHIQAQGLGKVERALQVLHERGVRKLPLMRILGTLMIHTVDKNFEAEGRPVKWKPRSPITTATLVVGAQNNARNTKRFQRTKTTRGQAHILRAASLRVLGNKILSGQGYLKKSIDAQVQDDQVEVGPSGGLPYARIHQLGGVIRPKHAKALAVPCGNRILRLQSVTIPARPYLTVPAEDVPVYARATVAYFEEALN